MRRSYGIWTDDEMIGLVVVTHGGLALELLKAAEHVCGPQAQVATVCVDPDDSPALSSDHIREAVAQVDSGTGAIVLTDVIGSSPSNAALSAANGGPSRVVAGVNVPMLIKLADVRKSGDMERAVREAKEAGRKYIVSAGDEIE